MKEKSSTNPSLSFFKATFFALAFLFFIVGQTNCSLAQTATSTSSASSSSSATVAAPAGKVYYLVSLNWDSSSNTLSLEDGAKPELATTNLVKDSGSGSQFYAAYMNAQEQYAINSEKTTYKYFLGKWTLPSEQKQGEIRITVPFQTTASKLVIVDVKTNKIALTVDVSRLSHPVAASAENKTTPTSTQAKLPANRNSFSVWMWVIIIILILLLGGGGYWLYRWYKKRKDVSTDTMSIPPRS